MAAAFHSLPYPALEEGNLSYPRGTYRGAAKSLKNGKSVRVTHRLENAGFIEQQIKEGRAEYGCLLSVPVTGHRELRRSSSPSQDVEWDIGIVGEPPIIRPIVVAVKDIKHTFSASDDVADIWVGRKIEIPKGARLARDTFLRSSVPSMQSLLNFIKDDTLSEGSFFVSADVNHGYRFNVYVAPDLFEFLGKPGLDDRLRMSIASHVVTCCFGILKQEFSNEEDGADFTEHSNLRMLKDLFEADDLALWTEDDFKPELAATRLYPLVFPDSADDEG